MSCHAVLRSLYVRLCLLLSRLDDVPHGSSSSKCGSRVVVGVVVGW